jgi:hypothetical protein
MMFITYADNVERSYVNLPIHTTLELLRYPSSVSVYIPLG